MDLVLEQTVLEFGEGIEFVFGFDFDCVFVCYGMSSDEVAEVVAHND